jgi:hypothetical protein
MEPLEHLIAMFFGYSHKPLRFFETGSPYVSGPRKLLVARPGS